MATRKTGILRAHTLDALARVGRGEDAAPVVRAIDPIIEWRARRRARAALFAAEQGTRSTDLRHIARLAFLRVALADEGVSPDDADAVSRAFDAAGGQAPPLPSGAPWLTVGLVVGVLVLVAAGWAISWLRRPFDPHRDAVGYALGDDLPTYLVALGRNPSAQPPRIASGVRRALGPEGAGSLEQLYAATAGFAQDPSAVDPFYAAAGTLNAALARSGSPYFVDTDVLAGRERARPLTYSFYVERERQATTEPASAPVRVLFVWRLDTLNVVQPYLGYTHPRAAAALVLFDQIEEELIDRVLPVLHRGEPMDLVDEETADAAVPWQRDLQARASDIVAQAFASDADATALAHMGDLIARRRAIVRKWKADLPLVGVRLVPPKRLVPEADYAGELRYRAPKATLDDWDDVHDELLGPASLATFERLRDRFARSTERHEVQHRLDYARGLVPVPARIAERLGLEDTLAAPPGSYAARCRDETSAFLAQIAEEEGSPALTLLLLSRYLFNRHEWGTAYSCASVAAYDMLSTTLAVPGAESRLVRGGSVVREELARRVLDITGRGADELRAAARKTWEEAYGATLERVTVRDVAKHTAWRH
jgi:hypothetical protein